MKVSFICTTKNEQGHIHCLLASIKSQTRQPDEIVFVDSKSTDGTLQILKQFKSKTKIPVRVFSQKTNRSKGRNMAIKKAKNPIIVATDAGCCLDKYWIERITKKIFLDKADAIAGFYIPITTTYFQKAVAPFVCVMMDKFNPDSFLPSSRSIAFTKTAWKKVGGYNNNLSYCEDLDFAVRLKDNTRLLTEKTAIVYWHQTSTFPEFFHQIKNYAKGDVEARHLPHLFTITTIYLRYIFFAIIPPLLALYLIWSTLKHYRYIRHYSAIIFTPALKLTSDIAIVFGTFEGITAKLHKDTPEN